MCVSFDVFQCYGVHMCVCVCVCMLGGLEKNKHLIITFPDVGLRHLDTPDSYSELLTTLFYFKTLIRWVWSRSYGHTNVVMWVWLVY